MFAKFSTGGMFENISAQNVWNNFEPKCSKSFQPGMFEKFSARNVRNFFDPTSSKNIRIMKFEKEEASSSILEMEEEMG